MMIETNRDVYEDVYIDQDLLNGVIDMKNLGCKIYRGDGTGRNYVIRDNNDRVLEVSYDGYKLSVDGENMIKDADGNTYVSGYAALQIENENLKRKVKKLKENKKKLNKYIDRLLEDINGGE